MVAFGAGHVATWKRLETFPRGRTPKRFPFLQCAYVETFHPFSDVETFAQKRQTFPRPVTGRQTFPRQTFPRGHTPPRFFHRLRRRGNANRGNGTPFSNVSTGSHCPAPDHTFPRGKRFHVGACPATFPRGRIGPPRGNVWCDCGGKGFEKVATWKRLKRFHVGGFCVRA